MSVPLKFLTFEELVRVVDERRRGAHAPDKIAGWGRLHDIATHMAGAEGGDHALLTGPAWWLTEVRVENCQGVASMAPLVIPSTPGITVLSGPNGSGKSSIAEAIDIALRGFPRARAKGSGGKAPLWERPLCSRGADAATVAVILNRASERLVLSVRLDGEDRVLDCRAVLHTGPGGAHDVDLNATPWASALAGYRPVFEYAAVERRVQLAGDLQEFLEPLLGLGGCFEELKASVTAAAAAPTAAADRWEEALAVAKRAVAEVDEEFRDDEPATSVDGLVWPTIADDPDHWLEDAELTESGTSVPVVTESHLNGPRDAVIEAVDALGELETVEQSLVARFAEPLRALSERAQGVDDPGETCAGRRRPGRCVPRLRYIGCVVDDVAAGGPGRRLRRRSAGVDLREERRTPPGSHRRRDRCDRGGPRSGLV